MSISSRIDYVAVDDLKLDPKNPRLREEQHDLSQPELLEVMTEWSLEELGASIVENGFWPHEALLVVREKLKPKDKSASLIVVEGNRRLAAVLLLRQAHAGKPATSKWRDLAKGLTKKDAEALEELRPLQPTAVVMSMRFSDSDTSPASSNGNRTRRLRSSRSLLMVG